MSEIAYNELGQCIGYPVDNWHRAKTPSEKNASLEGQYVTLEPLNPESHAAALFQAFAKDMDGANWTYLPYGPFDKEDDFKDWLNTACTGNDPYFYCIKRKSDGVAVGMASYLRIAPNEGSIEVGHIHFSPLIQRSAMSTEAMYLMMHHAFETLGHRRYEWKCNALNQASRKAAHRLGFSFEGIFRQMSVVKGHNRNTAWYSILDSEWPMAKQAFENWLSADNFEEDGSQITRLDIPNSSFLKDEM